MEISNSLRIGALLCAIAVISACAGPKINPPAADRQAILVIPVDEDLNVVYVRYGFYYVYEILRSGDSSFKHEVAIKFPVAEHILIVDSLPPGDYLLRKLTIKPVGSGNREIPRPAAFRYDPFKLEAGKITIFPQVLKLTMWNQDPGRIAPILSRIDMLPLDASYRNEVLATLKKLPNFDTWEISAAD